MERRLRCATVAAALPTRFIEVSAQEWGRLAASATGRPQLERTSRHGSVAATVLTGEVEQTYLPLGSLLSLQVAGAQTLAAATDSLLGRTTGRGPFVVGVTGSVAVGKSTTARLLQELLAQSTAASRVDLVSTDGFIQPNTVLERQGLLARKGFPESYDIDRLLHFLADIKAGRAMVEAPVYSHDRYDVVAGQVQLVRRPEILIVEGLHMLSTTATADAVVSDFLDFIIYVDAAATDIEGWYVERFLVRCAAAVQQPESYFHRYAGLAHHETVAAARHLWFSVNAVNLREYILPTRQRANLIVEKGADHRVRRVRLRTS